MRHVITALLGLGVVPVAVAAPGLPLPADGFEVFSIDGKGGGWVIHHQKGRGDSLWGCKDLAAVDSCLQVHLEEWKSAARIEAIHVSKDSQHAWITVNAPAMGEFLYACKDPEGAPSCKPVVLDMRPVPAPTIERVWPARDCAYDCDAKGDLLPETDWRRKIEDKAKADMWIEVSSPGVGATQLYACKGLAAEPACKLALPNWLTVDRQGLGIEDLDDVEDANKNVLPGAIVGKIDEGSMAYAAGFREGMKIKAVGAFEVRNAAHARFMLLQYPALQPIKITLDDGKVVEITAQRKPPKSK
jgi:hypothetical protein